MTFRFHLITTRGTEIVDDDVVNSTLAATNRIEIALREGKGVDVHPLGACESMACDGPLKPKESR